MSNESTLAQVAQHYADLFSTVSGLIHSDVVYDSSEIPDSVKHRSFRLMPTAVNPVASFGAIEMEVAWEVIVAFQPPPMGEMDTLFNEVFPLLDQMSALLLSDRYWAPPISCRAERDEEDRYILLVVGFNSSHCMNSN